MNCKHRLWTWPVLSIGAVFGWTYDVDENCYAAAKAGDRVQAGMMQLTEVMANVPRDWPVYLLVQDVEAAAQKVGELGGSLLVPVTSAGEVGKFCVVQDPRVPLSASSSTLAQYHRHLAISLDSEP